MSVHWNRVEHIQLCFCVFLSVAVNDFGFLRLVNLTLCFRHLILSILLTFCCLCWQLHVIFHDQVSFSFCFLIVNFHLHFHKYKIHFRNNQNARFARIFIILLFILVIRVYHLFCFILHFDAKLFIFLISKTSKTWTFFIV